MYLVIVTSQSDSIQGYHGCAAGKGKQVAKTEIEKLDLKNMTARQAVKEVARM